MPEYEFEAEDGSRIVRDYRISEAPPLETPIAHEGRIYRRVLSRLGALRVAPNVGFSSISLPLNWPYAPRHNESGEAVFHSKREVAESLARAQHGGEKVIYE